MRHIPVAMTAVLLAAAAGMSLTAATLPSRPIDSRFVPVTEFTAYASCADSTVQPSTGAGLSLSVAPDDPRCPKNFLDAVSTSLIGAGLQFQARFAGAAVAPNPFDELVVFATDDTANWTGQEFGVRCSLRDGIVYGYVQDGTHAQDGYAFFGNTPLGSCDGTTHGYSIVVRTFPGGTSIEFYVDGAFDGRVAHMTGVDYTAQRYTVVVTTHRWEGGWDSTGLGLYVSAVQGSAP